MFCTRFNLSLPFRRPQKPDLCAEALAGHGSGSGRSARVWLVTGEVSKMWSTRQSMLLTAEDFSVMFDKLESIFGDIGKPGGSLERGHHLLFQ